MNLKRKLFFMTLDSPDNVGKDTVKKNMNKIKILFKILN